MSGKTEWRKTADVMSYFYGIHETQVQRNPGAAEITSLELTTAGSCVRLVAYDDDCARAMIVQLRAACAQWEALLSAEVTAQAEVVGVS